MYEKFSKLLCKTNKTSYQVSKDTGIAQSVLSDWKRGRSKPKAEKLNWNIWSTKHQDCESDITLDGPGEAGNRSRKGKENSKNDG